MKTIFEKFEKYALEKEQMSKIKGGYHLEYINGEWVIVDD
jgi:natural product precursor